MDKNFFKGEWNEIKGKVKENWGKLTDDDLTRISGKKDQLLGYLQKRYGYAKERAAEDIKKFEKSCEDGVCDVDDVKDRFRREKRKDDYVDKRKVG